MYGALLRRAGFWLILAAVVLAIAPTFLSESSIPALARGRSLAYTLAPLGIALAVVGWLMEHVGGGAGRCPRCGRPSSSSSVFCTYHRQELHQAGRDAAERHRREHRTW